MTVLQAAAVIQRGEHVVAQKRDRTPETHFVAILLVEVLAVGRPKSTTYSKMKVPKQLGYWECD